MSSPEKRRPGARVLVTIAVSATLAAGSNLVLRHAMAGLGGDLAVDGALLLAIITTPAVLGGLVGYVVSYALWLHVLSGSRLGAAYPVYVSSLVVMVLAGSIFVLGEEVTLPRIGCVTLVIAGIAVAESGGER